MTLDLFPAEQTNTADAAPEQVQQPEPLPPVVAFLESRWCVFKAAYEAATQTAANLKADEIEHTRCDEYQVAFNWDVDSCRNGFDEITKRVIRRTVEAFERQASRGGLASLEVSAEVVSRICWDSVRNEEWNRDVKTLRRDFSPASLYTKLQKLYPPARAGDLIRKQAAAALKKAFEIDGNNRIEMKKSGRFTTIELGYWRMEKDFRGAYELAYQTDNYLSELMSALLAATNLIITDDPTSPVSFQDLHAMNSSIRINRRRFSPRENIGGDSIRLTFYTSKAELRLDNRVADAFNLFISENA